jgi:integrase
MRWKKAPQRRRYVNGGAMDLILNTGLRMGEALALQWTDINWKKNTVSVTKNLIRVKNRSAKGKKYKLILQEKPKTEKSKRIIPLNKAALAALEDLKTAPGFKPDGFIIHNKNGGAVLPRTLEETLENMCSAVGIHKIGVHALRHTYATRLFEKGVDIKIISELLGHSSTEITYRIYVHVIDALKESAVEALDLD